MTNEEICARIKVAYEQLGKCHTALCRYDPDRKNDDVIYDLHDILNSILRLEIKLGMLKREEDIK